MKYSTADLFWFMFKVTVVIAVIWYILHSCPKDPVHPDKIMNLTTYAKAQKIKGFSASSDFTVTIPVKFKYEAKGGGFTVTNIGEVTVTAYNNLPEQTNSKPNIGASNRKVFEGSIALSRDILSAYNVKYGDVACLTAEGKCYIVEDTMNKRYDNTISPASGWRADIFMYSKEEALKVNFKSDLMLIKQL